MSLAALLWAFVLLAAALPKARGMPRSMLRAMRDLGLPSHFMRRRYAYLHLTAQFILAFGLIVGPDPVAHLFTGGTVVLAGIYLIIVWKQRGFVCRCLTDTPYPITTMTVLRNIFLFALALMSIGAEGLWAVTSSDWPALIPFLAAAACEFAARFQNRSRRS